MDRFVAEYPRRRRALQALAHFLRGDGSGDSDLTTGQLQRRVEAATTEAFALELYLAKMPAEAVERRLFEVAYAESLQRLERKMFLRSRIVADDYDPNSVSWIANRIAWTFVILWIVGVAFFLYLFGAREGSSTTRLWLYSFLVGFVQNIFLFTPFRLFLVFIFVPSLMRHRLRPRMFTRIPRYAASVQVARWRPDLQVSQLILEGRIPRGPQYAQYIPPASSGCGAGCSAVLLAALFVLTAVIFMLPEEVQGAMLDICIAIAGNAVLIGFHRLYIASALQFAVAIGGALLLVFGLIVWRRSTLVKMQNKAYTNAAAMSPRRDHFPEPAEEENGNSGGSGCGGDYNDGPVPAGVDQAGASGLVEGGGATQLDSLWDPQELNDNDYA
ncbi:unnamed protein product [Phaeothamnion confervicola]